MIPPLSLKPSDDDEALHLARSAFQRARSGDAASLARLVDAGLPVNLRNERGDTLLMLTSYHGHVEATRVLLERGADPERCNDSGQTPLAGAAFKGLVEVARLLLEHGAHIDGAGGDGRTPLMFAAMFDQMGVMELLLQRGANREQRDVARRTALDSARAMGAWRTAARLEALASQAAS